jgi:hypothetical protein
MMKLGRDAQDSRKMVLGTLSGMMTLRGSKGKEIRKDFPRECASRECWGDI